MELGGYEINREDVLVVRDGELRHGFWVQRIKYISLERSLILIDQTKDKLSFL